jgi:hypothetical protein
MNQEFKLEEQEAQLGTALALIHRALGRIDEPARAFEVQTLLGRAISSIESVRTSSLALSGGAGAMGPELAAVISAAVAIMFDQPYKVLSVQKVTVPLPQSNAWAAEGRSDIFHSHRVR